MTVLDALNWPVLRRPRLAGFEVSPEGEVPRIPHSKAPLLDLERLAVGHEYES